MSRAYNLLTDHVHSSGLFRLVPDPDPAHVHGLRRYDTAVHLHRYTHRRKSQGAETRHLHIHAMLQILVLHPGHARLHRCVKDVENVLPLARHRAQGTDPQVALALALVLVLVPALAHRLHEDAVPDETVKDDLKEKRAIETEIESAIEIEMNGDVGEVQVK